jgi:hypothetical protein
MRPLVLFLVIGTATGCATHVQRMRDARAAFHGGDLVAAEKALERQRAAGGDADVLDLDTAMVALATGRPAEAERLLRRVRDRFDHLEQADAGETALTLLGDDTARAYPGEDHEKVLVRALLALADLAHDGDDAEAYSLQVIEEQQRIVAAAARDDGTNPKAAYPQVALAPYLRGVLREATHRDYDDAARYFHLVAAWQPEFTAGPTHHDRAAAGVHSRRGNGVVHVFALVGQGPFKAEVVEMPSSLSVAIAGELLAGPLGSPLPPTIAPITVPRIVAVPSGVAGLRVRAGEWQAGRTETLTDVSALAIRQQEAVHPGIVARAVARRTLKKGTIFGVQQGLGLSRGSLSAVALDVAGVAWEAAERADTRCWSTLPATIQACRVELPAGRHTLALEAVDRGQRPCGRPATAAIDVADGRDTFIVVHVPETGVVGRPLVGGR